VNRWGRIVTGAAAAVTLLLCATPGTAAADDAVALNGTYTVVSDGQWAKTNYRYHDEATVTQTWTITSSCATFQDCTGRVVSDAGWSADAVYASGRWRVRRTIENWQPCADGTTAPGDQSFEFWRPRLELDDTRLVGWDRTTGPSGACGINKWLNITMPLTLTRTP